MLQSGKNYLQGLTAKREGKGIQKTYSVSWYPNLALHRIIGWWPM